MPDLQTRPAKWNRGDRFLCQLSHKAVFMFVWLSQACAFLANNSWATNAKTKSGSNQGPGLTPPSLPTPSLRQRTHNSWKQNYCEYFVKSCSKVQSLAIGAVSSSRFSVQLIGAAAIPAVRQGTHSAKRPDSLHEHREYLEHAGEYWPQNAVKGNDRNSCHSFFDRSIAWYFDWYWLIFYVYEPLASQFV